MTCPVLPHHEAKVQLPVPALQLPHQLPASALQLPHQLPAPALQPPHQLPAPALQLPQSQVQRLQLPEAGVQPPASFLQMPDAALLLICTAASSRWDAGPLTAQALRCTCRALRASVDSLIDHLRLNTTLGEVSIEGYASAYGLWLLGYALLLLIRSAEAAQKPRCQVHQKRCGRSRRAIGAIDPQIDFCIKGLFVLKRGTQPALGSFCDLIPLRIFEDL